MLLPLMITVVAFLIEGYEILPQKDQFEVDEIIYNLKDKKVIRTIDVSSEQKKDIGFRNIPIDRTDGIAINLTIPDKLWKKYRVSRGFSKVNPVKTKWRDAKISINDFPERQALIRVHGWSSAQVDRKSFYIDLLSFQKITEKIRVRKFFLLNMANDPYNFKMKFSYQLLSKFGLFPSYNQFVVLDINGSSQGLYLMVERPEDAIKRVFPNVISVFRTRLNNNIEPYYLKPDYDCWRLLDKFQKVFSMNNFENQAELIEDIVDMESYLYLLAFNSLLQNGDTVDELFLYETKPSEQEKARLKFAAWDYDELQTEPMHSELKHKSPLIWGGSRIDAMIVENPVLYSRYKIILKKFLTEILTEKHLSKELEKVSGLLDGIDTGLDEQKAKRLERNIEVSKFKQTLFNRRSFLIEELNKN